MRHALFVCAWHTRLSDFLLTRTTYRHFESLYLIFISRKIRGPRLQYLKSAKIVNKTESGRPVMEEAVASAGRWW